MYTELTKEERDSILGNETFKGTLVCCDSEICHYCARKLYPDDEFEDAAKCNECIHGKYGRMTGCNHFLGIQCVTWKEE